MGKSSAATLLSVDQIESVFHLNVLSQNEYLKGELLIEWTFLEGTVTDVCTIKFVAVYKRYGTSR